MPSLNKSSLSWNERLALIHAHKPTDKQICATWNLSMGELRTAQDLEKNGTFTPATNLDVDAYSGIFSAPSRTSKANAKRPVKKTKATTVRKHKVVAKQPPTTATKPAAKAKKRPGRNGIKIAKALLAIPTKKVTVQSFLEKHGISLHVLRQAKRFDDNIEKGRPKVHVKQDPVTKELMVWRESKIKTKSSTN